MIRLAAVTLMSIVAAASAARADAPAPVTAAPNARPAWMLVYSENPGGAPIRIHRSVTTRADGALTWQQLDVDTGIVAHGPVHRCTGSAQLAGEELRAMEDAMRALAEPRPDAVPGENSTGIHAYAAVSLIVPREDGRTDVSTVSFDARAVRAEPRLKRAADIWSRYRCTG